jgi:hypothetical protein
MDISIIWLKSVTTGILFPAITQLGDSEDACILARIDLTSLKCKEVVLTQACQSLLNAPAPEAYLEHEMKINHQLGRNDLKVNWFLKSNEQINLQTGKVTKNLFYRDIFTDNGQALLTREESLEDFISSGGKLLRLDSPDSQT